MKREELGEGSAELLQRFAKDPKEFAFRNKTALLSGTKVLTLQETAIILAKIAKKPVKIRQVSDDDSHSNLWYDNTSLNGESTTLRPGQRHLKPFDEARPAPRLLCCGNC